ncbi:Udp-glucose 4-epimerase [Elysia marginata]|uniref:Udp-glucose 4-epimerase n=1 Tax=Elysia marginata TaxID=1093978 RepID=A0AAV4FI32_9GAST|nr:Udp-glucose 4-epimerase [Elysia marginata]
MFVTATEGTSPLLACLCRMLLGLWLVIAPGLGMAVEVPVTPKKILIFGGNGFMGTRTSELLIDAGHDLTLVNRGNWYWDSAFTVKPYTRHITCDRAQAIEKCLKLEEFLNNSEGLDAVIDFSAYHPQYMEDALSLLTGKVGLYIYISTDSVYEVCEKNHTEPSLETDAVRPSSPDRQAELEATDSYGHYKLACEEVLARHRREGSGPPYISLRLPDVVGPRDSTYRWWIYQLWMRLRHFLEKDVIVPAKVLNQPISLAYVEDVAQTIFQLVQSRNKYESSYSPEGPPLDQAYNLALHETPTLYELLKDIRHELNLTDSITIKTDGGHETIKLYPSVHAGPMNISKAVKLLGWSPTNYSTVVKDTVEFYEKAISTVHFDDPRRYMIRTMQTYFTSKPYDVIRGLGEVYQVYFGQRRDEL